MAESEEKLANNELIGIHCTNGVNRTGYLIVYYLCVKYKMPLQDALSLFDEHRKPHMLENELLNVDLKEKFAGSEEGNKEWLVERHKKTETYRAWFEKEMSQQVIKTASGKMFDEDLRRETRRIHSL